MVFAFFVSYFNHSANLFSPTLSPFLSPPASEKEGPFPCCWEGGAQDISSNPDCSPGASLLQPLCHGPSACDPILSSIAGKIVKYFPSKNQSLLQRNAPFPSRLHSLLISFPAKLLEGRIFPECKCFSSPLTAHPSVFGFAPHCSSKTTAG